MPRAAFVCVCLVREPTAQQSREPQARAHTIRLEWACGVLPHSNMTMSAIPERCGARECKMGVWHQKLCACVLELMEVEEWLGSGSDSAAKCDR